MAPDARPGARVRSGNGLFMDPADAPRHRRDLDLSPVTEGERTLTVVHDPRTGRYFRIGEVEGFICACLDGERTLRHVHEEVLREFPGVQLSIETVVGFAVRLRGLGWLEGRYSLADPGQAAKPPWYRRFIRTKLPPVPADGLYRLGLPLVRLLYRPWVLALVILLVLWTGAEALFRADELYYHRPHLASASGFLATFVGLFSIGIIHELGHGLTCRYFGARSNGIGFFLMYGLPCFYCDVSGAWTLSSRAQRLAIGAAGLGWQFAAGAVAFTLWRALEPSTFPARVCFAMISACGLMALVNLNPFLKLDGYYLLSDWLRIPNLREKSLRYFGGNVRWLLVGADRPALGNPRERRIFFWFGLLSGLYTLLLVGFIAWRLSHWMLATWHGWGALLLGVLLMSILSNWLKGWLTNRKAKGKGAPGASAPPSGRTVPAPPKPVGEAAEAKTVEATPPPRKPLLTWGRFRLAITLSALCAAGYWFWNARWTFFVASPCTLEAEERVAVRPQVEGVLREVMFEEGDPIRPGKTFAILETTDLVTTRKQLRQKAVAVEAMSRAIALEAPILSGEREREVVEARLAFDSAKSALDDMRAEFQAKRGEAGQRVAEARSGLDTAEEMADRLRRDERDIAEGRLTPPMRAVTERIARLRTQVVLAEKEQKRAAFLVNEGALQRQRLDVADAEMQGLRREEAALQSDLAALQKELREKREDAEAEVKRSRAAYETVREAEVRVREETRDEKLRAQQELIAARQSVLDRSVDLRGEGDVKTAEASAKRLEADPIRTEMDRVERKIRETRITSPAGGIISTPRLHEKLGKRVSPGEVLAWIDRLDWLKAKVFVEEREIGYVRREQAVQFRVGAFPDRIFEGRVTEISPRPVPHLGKSAYEVRLRVKNPGGDLRPGITGYAKVISGDRPLREVIFRKMHRYFRTEVWTWF